MVTVIGAKYHLENFHQSIIETKKDYTVLQKLNSTIFSISRTKWNNDFNKLGKH